MASFLARRLLSRSHTHRTPALISISISISSIHNNRSFHATPHRPLQIHNPQTDSSGNPLTISITPAASTRLSQILSKEPSPTTSALRVLVESGGCHGFQYTMSLTDKIDPEEDTIFEEESNGAKVVMDLPSLELLNGSKVDYESALIGSQFKIVDNPAATSSCGCGTSFDVKF
ncbi:[4Fe-4S] proteins maturation [Orbilia oligospora]|uniref:[4Fe-4S] proteins maturation n=1 Tax=Orbilia oligospora TaxID=2813651 RepID=A0A7C8JM86_ORBOL|nr:[4Fe-4S] proteins maturation [Orbilia oligospora]KAF3149886.1 [4Fe-4S] proteins maturation [Orbilia oligospora]KAF3153078.1 [4Fe-4S] proteins maturation [Orbilia oligospora]